MEYRRRTVAGNDWGARSRQRAVRRLSCPNGVDQLDCDYDDDDSVNNNNNNSGSASAAVNANDTTALVDELEQLRTDNFQLRLRVYNAERRVDRLSASAARSRDDDSDGSDSGSGTGSSSEDDDDDDDDEDARALAAAKATAGAAVRTVHDLLTVNRRLLALLAAAVSAKAVAVTADDKRRWQKLRHRVHDCGAGAPQIKEHGESEREDDDAEGSSASENSETRTSARKLDAPEATARHVRLRSPPPPPPPPPPLQPDTRNDDEDDDAGGSELVRLRARCRRLERSLQQLVNTELWARNRQIGKLEQQRYVTQVQQAALQKERRSAAVVPQLPAAVSVPVSCKGILVKKSPPPSSPPAKEPVLPDYSEVNFFYTCDEDDEEDDRENDSETNVLTDDETQSGNEPVKSSAATVGAPLASSSTQVVGSQKRQRRRRRPKNDAARTAEASSSTESLSVTVGDSTDVVRRGHRRVAAGSRRRRRCCRSCRSSTCGRCAAGDADRCSPTRSTADAQVQCDGAGGAADGGDDQAGLLRRELEARRRENCRLYDMLLRLQRDRGSKACPPEDRATAAAKRSDDDGSPEPYGRAARAVRGRIADLLRPSAGPTADGSDDEQTVLRLQQQQQLLLLARLRERIVAYERQELLGGSGDDRVDAASPAADRDNAVEHMDRAALVNVALPRAVDRLRRALVPLLHHKQQRKRSPSPVETERDSSVG